MSATHPISVQYRNIDPTEYLTKFVEQKATRLRRKYPAMHSCTVQISRPNSNHKKGNVVQSQITVNVAGKSIVSTKKEMVADDLIGAFSSVTAAFEATDRTLSKHVKKQTSNKIRSYKLHKLDLAY